MDFCEIFSDRLKQLMTENNIEEKALAEKTAIELSCLYSYLRKDSYPSLDSAVKIAKYFSCSLDYLFGFSEDFTKEQFVLTEKISVRFQKALREAKISRYALSKRISVSQTTLSLWYNGIAVPKLESLLKISEALDISLDYLAGRKE